MQLTRSSPVVIQAGKAPPSGAREIQGSRYGRLGNPLSKGEIVARIRERQDRGLSLRSSDVRRDEPSLFRSAKVRYGPKKFWRKAVESAGIPYESISGKQNWKSERVRLERIREAVRAKAKRQGVAEGKAAKSFRRSDFKEAGLDAMLGIYYRGSPKLAIRAAYGIELPYAMKGELDTWEKVEAHVRRCLRHEDCERLTHDRFIQLVPHASRILAKFGGFVEVMDRTGLRPFDPFKHTAPRGFWKKKDNRIRWVKELVGRFRADCSDPQGLPRDRDFVRCGLGGLLASRKTTPARLLRDAGFTPSVPRSWKKMSVRVGRVREIAEAAGGPAAVAVVDIQRAEPGLYNYYTRSCKRRSDRGNTPLLYEILKDAGYEVTPEECERGLGGSRYTRSRHAHVNESQNQAIFDDWIFDIVGDRHRHNVEYPGQASVKHR